VRDERRVVLVEGGPAAYREAGAGLPLVLVHGAASRSLVWQAQLTGLDDMARVIAPDLPGHGETAGPGRSRIDDYAAWVVAFCDAVGLDRVILGGHSMGGAVAQRVALGHPGRLRGLVLVGTGASLRVATRLLTLLRAGGAEGPDLVRSLSYSLATPPERVLEASDAIAETPPLVTLGDYLACDGFDVRDELPRLRLPTLVVVGRDDRLTPPKLAAELAATIPQAQLVEIAAAGHFPQLEQPAAVTAALRTFLRGPAQPGWRR
jgi:pimeloyl-ACP methyl ester carboxylesterase